MLDIAEAALGGVGALFGARRLRARFADRFERGAGALVGFGERSLRFGEPVGGVAPRRSGGLDLADQALAHFGKALRRVFELVALAFGFGAALGDGGDLGGGAVLAFAPGRALAGD